MSLEEVQVSSLIPASPNAIYAAWMDSRRHSAITGSVAVINPWVGGRVSARARFVEATHVKLDTGKQILLAWRTQDFPPEAADSHVEILLQPAAGGTKVSIHHTQIPAGHSAAAREIWRAAYLDPMKRYFGKSGAMEAAHRAATRAGQMPTADMVGMRRARTPITSAGNVHAPMMTDDPPPKARRVILRKKKGSTQSDPPVTAAPPASKKATERASHDTRGSQPGTKTTASSRSTQTVSPASTSSTKRVKAAPKKAAPKKAAPKKAAPRKAAPKKAAPKKAAPKKAAPKKAAPKKAAPKQAAPKKAAPKKTAPKKRR
ncbi:MAG: SRPBCC domain-containing protein [Sandaracinaceae bacterium]|nr:SRPBCC domain-containing protein [Sandaracinaceae bacterium]